VLVAGFVGVAAAAVYLSPTALTANSGGDFLYIAEATANQVAVWSVADGKVVKVISLPDPPSGIALGRDETCLYVTGASPEGRVHVVNPETGTVDHTLPAGHTPNTPVLSADGKTLYVCNQFTNDVSVIDLTAKKELMRIPVLREPVAAAITPDGRFLFVANHLPVGPSNADYAGAAVSVIDTAARKVVKNIPLFNGSTGLRGVCLSPDGKYAYVTHILARYQLPTTQLERGWMNTNAVSVIDATNQRLINTVLLDDVDLGAANPWGVACTEDGKYLCVTHAGTHELSVIDRTALQEKLAGSADSTIEVANDLSFLVGLRRRVPLSGNGPRGLALVGTRAYVAQYFTDSLGVVDIDPKTRHASRSLRLGPKEAMTDVRKGEMFFHDARLCFQKWQSCASCHPGGGRADGLNWDLLNDGIGNPKNTKSLLLSHKTPPAMNTGVRTDAEAAVRAGIRFIQFAVRPGEDAAAIDEYLKSLKPVPSPHLVNGRMSPAAIRGKEVFEKAGCAECHPAPLYTDLKKYDMETGRGMDAGREFDTPTMVEVWRTAPYLHDGRAATLEKLFKKSDPEKSHGEISTLTDDEIADLIEFNRSL
jgi:YVTN family beta-propeller protein